MLTFASAPRAQACEVAEAPPWPPSEIAKDMMSMLCPCPGTLGKYFMACRSILAFLRAPMGKLADTKALVAGACKAQPPGGTRYKARASHQQVSAMLKWLREEARSFSRWGGVAPD